MIRCIAVNLSEPRIAYPIIEESEHYYIVANALPDRPSNQVLAIHKTAVKPVDDDVYPYRIVER